ncbi:hypothetical protein D9757_001443 [Collybiopsis confluens]|uniref:Transmembrane protein n=1 Tax=Collybiopsis confluens TaxID=2823264 RepID=A0A8H5MFS5_9AGAR|nr:hypothetical protein D9757_001443 [Collybiopsis confluens]
MFSSVTQSVAQSIASPAAEASTTHIIQGTQLPFSSVHDVPVDLDAVDQVFGRSSYPREEDEALPPYIEEPPAYSSSGSNEPVTLAMYLFKFGFLFPPFWIIGACILASPLRQPESTTPSSVWLPEKTEDERKEIIQKMRKTEVKWATRCLIAFCIFIALAVGAALTVWGVLRS